MAFGALFNPQRAGGGQNYARDGSCSGSDDPTLPRSRSSETGSCTKRPGATSQW